MYRLINEKLDKSLILGQPQALLSNGQWLSHEKELLAAERSLLQL